MRLNYKKNNQMISEGKLYGQSHRKHRGRRNIDVNQKKFYNSCSKIEKLKLDADKEYAIIGK